MGGGPVIGGYGDDPAADTAPEPVRRSLVAAEYLQPEQDGQVRVLLSCDCGTPTDLTVAIEGEIPGKAEAAFTCDGCQTVHWFEIRTAG